MSLISTLFSRLGIVWDDITTLSHIIRNSGCMPRFTTFMVTIETTSVCNLRCPLCPTGTGTLERNNKYIPLPILDRILELTMPLAKGFILSMWGEPTLHPELKALLDRFQGFDFWISTNLNYSADIAQELARRRNVHVICSVDTTEPNAYPQYRVGGNFDKVLDNIKILAKGACTVYPQFLIRQDSDIAPCKDFALLHGIPVQNVVIKTKRENFRLDHTLAPIPGRCHSPYSNIFFNCDGQMLPCCNNVRSDLHMAHISDLTSPQDILFGIRAKAIRRTLAQDKNVFPSCISCYGETFARIRLPLYKSYLVRLLRRRPFACDAPKRMPY